MLRRLAWSSVPSASFSAARLNEIIAPSRRNNERNHISGVLLFTGAQFLGILEGDDRNLEKLWLKLEQDTRHSDLVRIGEERCIERWFPEWMMAYLDHADIGGQIDGLRSPLALATKWSELIRPIMMRADSM
jgi:Sensors of blue-light using FAD